MTVTVILLAWYSYSSRNGCNNNGFGVKVAV